MKQNHKTRRAFALASIALTALVLASFAAISAAESPAELKPINVKDFGAKGDGVTDDTAAINAAIVAAQKQGVGAVVSLPSGRYKTTLGKEKSIRITGADGLTFQGEGDTTIVSGDLDEPVFRLLDSKSVTVRKLSIDHDPLGYTQGTITGVDIPNMTCEVTIDPGYPAPNDPRLKGSQVHAFVFPEKNYYQLDRYWPNPSEMVKTGEHTWSWKLKGPPNIDNWPGKRFFIYAEGRSHAFILSNLRDTSLEDINYWGGGANAGFYVNGLEGTTTFRRFVIGVPPGSTRLYSCAGGGQISGLRGKLLLDQCDFSKIDDGIDILSNYTRITEQRDKRTLVVQAKNSDYRAGDRVELWDWLHKRMRSDAIITTATSNPGGTFVIALDRDVVTEHVGVGVGMNFSRESMTDGIDRLINVATVGQETIIRDSKFQVFRAKCLNLKAANCTIERCTFSNSFQPAISAAPEWYFEEGSSIRNLTVRDCTFTDNNHPNIDIGASPLSGVPGTKPIVSDAPEHISHDSTKILIEGNSFTGFGTTPSVFDWNWPVGPAITITNAAHVMIRGNTFGPLAETAPKGTPKILIQKSSDVEIMDNKGISAEETTVPDLTSASSSDDEKRRRPQK
ncbi:MAG: glycosyl hydrolase family 28-related protein [Prosthecobacter sp.]|uniref:right-handed parallel beta-helix repeat-containing protein n=1 Tax=Prosthecobacter sp. TaxID=1965333 RepID=UPI003901C12C